MPVFDENDSRRLSNYLQTHIFWKFAHISRTYNHINCRNIWFAKVTITLIMMAQMLFLIFFSKNTRTLSPLSCFLILEIFWHSHAGDFLTQHIRISDGALLVGISESFLNFKKQDFSTNQQSFMLSFEVVIFLFCSTCMV